MQTKMELLQEHAATSRLTQVHPFWATSVSKVALFHSFFRFFNLLYISICHQG